MKKAVHWYIAVLLIFMKAMLLFCVCFVMTDIEFSPTLWRVFYLFQTPPSSPSSLGSRKSSMCSINSIASSSSGSVQSHSPCHNKTIQQVRTNEEWSLIYSLWSLMMVSLLFFTQNPHWFFYEHFAVSFCFSYKSCFIFSTFILFCPAKCLCIDYLMNLIHLYSIS